jgi:hypothetical protein
MCICSRFGYCYHTVCRDCNVPELCLTSFIICSSHTVAQPETKEELRSVARATKAMPGQRIIEMQRGLLPLLGYDADFGVSCLNKINQTFPNDRELYQKFQMYAAAAEFAGT